MLAVKLVPVICCGSQALLEPEDVNAAEDKEANSADSHPCQQEVSARVLERSIAHPQSGQFSCAEELGLTDCMGADMGQCENNWLQMKEGRLTNGLRTHCDPGNHEIMIRQGMRQDTLSHCWS